MTTTGRPTIYTEEIAKVIFTRMAMGESVRSICRDPDMPARSTVMAWAYDHKDFSDQYERAIQIRAMSLVDEIIDIADDGSNDWMERNDPENPGYKTNGEALQRSRLRMDARKWVSAKLMPQRYGESQQLVVKKAAVHEVSEVTKNMTAEEAAAAYERAIREG